MDIIDRIKYIKLNRVSKEEKWIKDLLFNSKVEYFAGENNDSIIWKDINGNKLFEEYMSDDNLYVSYSFIWKYLEEWKEEKIITFIKMVMVKYLNIKRELNPTYKLKNNTKYYWKSI